MAVGDKATGKVPDEISSKGWPKCLTKKQKAFIGK
jgi:hypothetical protein